MDPGTIQILFWSFLILLVGLMLKGGGGDV